MATKNQDLAEMVIQPQYAQSAFEAQLQSFGLGTHALNIEGQPPLIIEQIVRVVPQKRLVCKASWGGQAVYIKFFIGSGAQRYAKRDADGIASLTQAAIPTPTLLLQQAFLHGQLLIFAAIAPAQNAAEVWPDLRPDARLTLAKRLVKTVAKHHNAQLIQSDLYLKNFLVQDAQVYSLDGDGIRHSRYFKTQQATHNLCVLLSKFDVLDLENWLPDLIDTYQQARTTAVPYHLDKLKRQIARIRHISANRYAAHKVFRQCTDVQVQKRHDYFFAVARAYLPLALPTDSHMFDQLISDGVLLKAGRTCTVARLQLQAVSLAVKRYNIKDFWHRLHRLFRQTRAAASWTNAHRLQLLGLPSANPVVLLELRTWGLLRGRAYFVSEYLDAPDSAQFFAEQPPTLQAAAAEQVATLFYRLYLLNISHGDMKASNVKICDGKPVLIDLDSMRQHRWAYFGQKAHVRDLRRFMQNWQEMPALYNTFVRAFKKIYKDHAPLTMARF